MAPCRLIILVIRMKIEPRELDIIYDNASTYLTADNCAVGVKSYGKGVVIKSTAKSGYAILNDNAKYFGPYANAGAAKEMLNFIKQKFMIRQCKKFKSNTSFAKIT